MVKRILSAAHGVVVMLCALFVLAHLFPVALHNFMARSVRWLGLDPQSIPYWYGAPGVVGEAVYVGNAVIIKQGRYGAEPVWLQNNPAASDTSWLELQRFLAADDTDTLEYTSDTRGSYAGQATGSPAFVCVNFAERLHNRAEDEGIRCAYVLVDLKLGRAVEGHALNAFQTTDRGLVFIDCTGQRADASGPVRQVKTVYVAVGAAYRPRYLLDSAGWKCDSMGTVRKLTVQW